MLKKAMIFAALLAVVFPVAARAESQVGPRMKAYFKDAFLPHLWRDTKLLFITPENWVWFGVGGAFTVAAHQYQWDVNEYWEDNRLPLGADDFGNDVWGRGELQAALALSLMTGGYHFEDEDVAAAGEVLVEAQIIQGAIINIIKPIVDKERPNGGDGSFPSGHTGTAFCTAAVIQDRFGWGPGLPAYVFAAVTALARMDVQAHWLPDTVMGATIAMVTGYTVSRNHDPYPYQHTWNKKGARVALIPMIGYDSYGLSLHAVW